MEWRGSTHLDVGVLALVFNLDTGTLVEWHGEVTIGSTVAAEFVQLGGFDRHGEGQRFKVAWHRITCILSVRFRCGRLGGEQTNAKEISDRS